MKTKLVFLSVFALVGIIVAFALKNSRQLPQPKRIAGTPVGETVNYKASFLIFTNGTRRDFSAERYHNLNEIVYINPESPTTINVKKSGVTWGEFFATLPMKLEPDCLTTGTGQEFCNGASGTLKFYVNGERAEDFLEREIKHGERALITFGRENATQIEAQLSKVPTPE